MGLWKILTTPWGDSSTFSWKEPTGYRIRLRGDGWLRLAVALGAWAFGIGLLCIVFANNVHRPGPALAVGLGSLFGLIAAVWMFFRRDQVSGRVQADDDEIRRYRTYAGLGPGGWAEWQHWPYDAISACSVVSPAATGKAFGLLVLSVGDAREIVGLPASVDLGRFARHLASRGVTVSQGKGVPRWATTRLNVGLAAGVPVVGLVMMAVGLGWLWSARGGDGAARPAVARAGDRALVEPVPNDGMGEPEVDPNAAANATPPAAPPTAMPEGAGFGGRRFGPGGFGPGQFGPGGARPGGFAPGAVGGPGVAPGSGPAAGSNPPGAGTTSPPNDAGKTAKSALVGAPGGFDFMRIHPERKPVLGFRSTFGSWAGKQWIGRLEPLYGGDSEFPGFATVLAKPGYAVGGLLVDTPEFVNAYAVVFQRVGEDGTLDPDDSYTSDWVGPKSNDDPRRLSSDGRAVLGIHGRAGAILNAVGLVFDAK